MKARLYLITLMICFCFKAKAQDPIFTQYFMVPETLNPGFSGFEQATYFGVMHRTQWPHLDLQVDTQYAFLNTWLESSRDGMGIGFSILNQHETSTNYNHFQFNGNFAYIVSLANDWYFRPAIEVGYGMKSFNFRNLLLSDQININAGTISATSVDPFANNANSRIGFFDFTAGIVFDKQNRRNNTDLWLGAAVKHLNQPNISFIDNANVPLDILYTVHGNYRFEYYDHNDMILSLNYMQQGQFNRLDLAATIKLHKLFLGAMAVTNPAKNSGNSHLLTSVNALVGLEFERLRFGFSYDFNTSNIGRTDGVYELSITYLADCLICRSPTNNERRK
ncbi:PorP/SprF family type IX secretion system membrane protein [Hyunsoonleella sp. SJ7]|uniref:PorP/SprF family type IX secretion system membrane protein n=1 Tax=Hyunsoonleella aquatilis TaxID=2762758 RepID=A0A923H894_9FLAO|nr:PorP/SprF family type IX secretion system membrane protein [Hyunsoonleella aquatilis]MBC3758881.1 PorP/SprF family type IX secretion system membrane protein [Hyunsoonleella aquatilis]